MKTTSSRRRWPHLTVFFAVALLGMITTASGMAAAGPKDSKPETSAITTPLNFSSAAGGYTAFASTEGYYDKYGLSVTAPAGDSSQAKAAFATGSTPLGNLGVLDTLNLVSAGVPIKIIGCQHLLVPFQMWAKTDIKSAKALKGKTIGTTSSTPGAFQVATVQFLQANKLAATDVTFVPLGSVPNIMAALIAGRIDAALLSYPYYDTAAQEGGLHKLGDSLSPPNAIAANSDWAKENHNTILAYLKGNTEGLAAYGTQKAKAIPALAKFLRLSLDDPAQAATVEEGYKIYRNAWVPIAPCDKTFLDAYIPFLPVEEQAKLTKVSKLLDNTYIQELVDQGFYTKLAAKYPAVEGLPGAAAR